MKPIDPEILRLARARRGLYLAALSAPADKRVGLLALVAFDAELARIPQAVSEPMLGRIRLQWWVDALPGVTGGRPPSHPVAQGLAPWGLDLAALRGLVEARNFDLDDGATDVAEHLQYAHDGGGALALLMLDVLGVTDDEARAAARAVGAAWALVQTLEDGLRVASDADAAALRAEARGLLAQAHARVLSKALPRAQRRAALPVLALARLARRKLDDPSDPLGAGAVMSVWWGSATGRF